MKQSEHIKIVTEVRKELMGKQKAVASLQDENKALKSIQLKLENKVLDSRNSFEAEKRLSNRWLDELRQANEKYSTLVGMVNVMKKLTEI